MVKKPTDEEAWALESMWTDNPPDLLDGTGPLTRRRQLLSLLDEMSANYILTRAERDKKTPAQVVADMVRHEIAAHATSTI
jgi:hypothetical protein